MVLVVVMLVCAVLAGWALGGSVRNLARVRLRATWLVFAAVGLQLSLGLVGARGGPVDALATPLLAASQLAVVGFVAANRYLPGMPLVLLGLGLNALVIIPNGGMPVSADALRAVGGATATIAEPGKHRLLTEADVLPALADVIAVPLLRTVISVGDLVLAAGIGVLVVGQMRRHPRPAGRRARWKPAPGPRGLARDRKQH
ncbi:MAG: DUF5317 domain-containing protein [Egibacteraceae bacterium]